MKREERRLEDKLRKFPRHKMDESKRKDIHDTLMKSRMNRTSPKKNKQRKTRFVVGLASVAALMLFVVLGLNIFPDAFTRTTGDETQSSEESGLLNTHNKPDKQTPNKAAPDSEQTDESNDHSEEVNESSNDESQENNQNTEESSKNNETTTNEQPDIETLSNKMIDALDNRDMETVADHVHPEKGLLFSPYVYVADDAVVFEKDEVGSMLDQDEQFDWGNYDGKGTPIELTPTDFFDEFLDMTPFQNPNDILLDEVQRRGNTINNIKDVFPDSHIIEYYNNGSEEYVGIDWESVNFVYEEDETGELYLVAIVRDMWTV